MRAIIYTSATQTAARKLGGGVNGRPGKGALKPQETNYRCYTVVEMHEWGTDFPPGTQTSYTESKSTGNWPDEIECGRLNWGNLQNVFHDVCLPVFTQQLCSFTRRMTEHDRLQRALTKLLH